MSDIVDFPIENKRNILKDIARTLIKSTPDTIKKPRTKWLVIGIGNVVNVISKDN